jgi:hypothetical protein
VVSGEAQGEKPPPSRLHSKVEPDSEALKPKVGALSLLGLEGPESIEVSGGVVSTMKLRVAGVGSVFEASSMARTEKAWWPSGRKWALNGELQEEKVDPSRLHSKVDPASSESNAKLGLTSLVGPSGPESIEVLGASVSTVKPRLAEPVCPTTSVPETVRR